MLTEIAIKNFAIISSLNLEVGRGMTVFTGETGSGKSIILEALSFALGRRVDTSLIRHEQDEMEVSLIFDLNKHFSALDWLKEQAMEDGQECIVRRVLKRSGRSKCFINGRPATGQMLRSLAQLLINFHGQHDNHALLKVDTQRQLLDEFANHDELVDGVKQLAKAILACQSEIENLQSASQLSSAEETLLRYQVDELKQLNPTEDEYLSLVKEHTQLAKTESIQDGLASALNLLDLDIEQNALGLTEKAIEQLKPYSEHHDLLPNILSTLQCAKVELEETSKDLMGILDSMSADPQRFNELDARLQQYQDVARKHRTLPANLESLLKEFEERLQKMSHLDEQIQGLIDKQAQLKSQFVTRAEQLSAARKRAALELESKIGKTISSLNMKGSQFKISVEANSDLVHENGIDRIEFCVSANPGQPIKPLQKVASGGELSRISLAIQSIIAKQSNGCAMIFDEVDVGIGGATAEIVGQLLRKLSRNTQVFCVTHLGQVAACANDHIQISKSKSKNATTTKATMIRDSERVEEIARMIGGLKLTESCKKHARELLAQF